MKIDGKTRRATVTRTEVATLRRWRAGEYSLIEVKSTLGLPKHWLVTQQLDQGEIVIGRHRRKDAALKTMHKLLGQN